MRFLFFFFALITLCLCDCSKYSDRQTCLDTCLCVWLRDDFVHHAVNGARCVFRCNDGECENNRYGDNVTPLALTRCNAYLCLLVLYAIGVFFAAMGVIMLLLGGCGLLLFVIFSLLLHLVLYILSRNERLKIAACACVLTFAAAVVCFVLAAVLASLLPIFRMLF